MRANHLQDLCGFGEKKKEGSVSLELNSDWLSPFPCSRYRQLVRHCDSDASNMSVQDSVTCAVPDESLGCK